MAYEALYNKYRPLTFDDMVGQEAVVQVLQNSLERERVSHGYLFTGGAGTGKTTSSRIFAKALNCHEGLGHICGKCPECLAIDKGTSPNVLEIDGASNGTVEMVRKNVIERIKFKPSARYRIIYIDEVHALSVSAFNALLKVLEEPDTTGNHVVFIFATTNPEKVLPTVLSRVQRYDLKSLTVEDIVGRLRYISDKENIEVVDDILYKVAKFANGGMRDAISTLDKLANFNDGFIDARDVDNVLGMASEDSIFQIIEAVRDNEIKTVFEVVDELSSTNKNIELFFGDLIQSFDLLCKVNLGINLNKQLSSIQFTPEFTERLMGMKDSISNNVLMRFIKLALEAERGIKYSHNKQLTVINTFMELMKNGSNNGVNEESSIHTHSGSVDSSLIQRIERLEKIIESGNFGSSGVEAKKVIDDIKSKIHKEVKPFDNLTIEEAEKKLAMESEEVSIEVDNELIMFLLDKTEGELIEVV